MPRSMWSGAISFGLVNVPVKLYSAVSRKTVRFHQLNSEDRAPDRAEARRLGDRRRGPVRGHRQGLRADEGALRRHHARGARGARPREDRTIDIEDFVDLADIDPIYYDHPYYLVPDKGAAKAYGLLLQAMEESEKVAIARVVIRSKEQLVAIRPAPGGVLMMETMIFADEVVPPEEIDDLPGGQGAQGLRPRGQDGPAADRLAVVGLRAGEVPRRVPREGARADRAQGGRRGDRRPARGAGAEEGARPDGGARGEPRGGQGRLDGDGKAESKPKKQAPRRRARRPPRKS